jgi:4-oxalocrotonate tautomerase
MPIVRIEMLEGRSAELKAELILRVTDALVTTLAVQPAQVRVLLYELPAAHWAVGGVALGAASNTGQDDRAEGGAVQ